MTKGAGPPGRLEAVVAAPPVPGMVERRGERPLHGLHGRGRLHLEGDLDLRAFLGLSKDGRPGYEGIQLNYWVKSDAPREKIEELCAYVQQTSQVLDIIRNPVPVTVTLND